MSAGLNSLLQIDARVRVVDIGANPIDGNPPYATLLQSGQADVLGFEPQPEALAELNLKKGPHETYLPHAIGDGGEHTLHFCAAPGMTSIFEPNPAVLNLLHGFPEWGRVLRTEKIKTLRLDDIPEAASFDFLKIDVQGAELMIFEHAASALRNALIIQTEVESIKGSPSSRTSTAFCAPSASCCTDLNRWSAA
jgi:FkbM family methyltransferase